jgi:cation diffusion facilitator family transporter
LILGILLVVAKLIAGVLTGSLGLISDGVHSVVDVVTSILALLAVRAANKPADREHPFGHGRAENLAAFVEGIVLLAVAVGIALEAVRRLILGRADVNPAPYAFLVIGVAIAVEAVRGIGLMKLATRARSDALAADSSNRFADVAAGLAVLAGLIGIHLGLTWADAAAALMVATLLTLAAARILGHSADILIDRAAAAPAATLATAVAGIEGVEAVRSVRIRRSGPQLLGEATVATRRMMSLEEAGALTDQIQAAAARAIPNLELTLVLEGQRRASDLVERVHAAAARYGQVRDLHNVTIEREGDGSLHLSMHAKVSGELTLMAADLIAAGLEQVVRSEFVEASRVDIHLEPLEPELISGQDVTRAQAALTAKIRAMVDSHSEVLECGDVELSSRSGHITAHIVMRLAENVTLQHAHSIESLVQARVRQEFPELDEIVTRASV